MKKIFISYNRKSEEAAQRLADGIKTLGHSAWLDKHLTGGQSWWNEILKEIRSCDLFIFVLEQEALDSIACKREYEYAAAIGKPVLPVLVSGDVSTGLLPPALSEIQFVSLVTQDGDAPFRLARAISDVQPALPLPDPLPEPPLVPLSYLADLAERVDSTSNLSFESQSGLLVDLRAALQDLESEKDTRILLERFRGRKDLLSAIGKEVDALLVDGQGGFRVSWPAIGITAAVVAVAAGIFFGPSFFPDDQTPVTDGEDIRAPGLYLETLIKAGDQLTHGMFNVVEKSLENPLQSDRPTSYSEHIGKGAACLVRDAAIGQLLTWDDVGICPEYRRRLAGGA